MKLRGLFQKLEFIVDRMMRIAFILCLGTGVLLLADSVPNSFQSGDLISSSQLNANFTTLVSSISTVKTSVTSVETSTGAVGSIRAALFDETDFATATGDPGGFDATVSKWALADGRDVTGSKFESISGNSTLPDLRGMFLRGINGSRADGLQDPDGARAAGAYQADQFASHNHTNGQWSRLVRAIELNTVTGGIDHVGTSEPDLFVTAEMLAAGGNETRPRNAAVYYYVRIN